MFLVLKNSFGLSLLESVIGMGVAAGIGAGMAQMIYNANVDNKKLQIKMTATSLKTQLMGMVINDNIWQATRNNDGNDGSNSIKLTQSFYCFDESPHCNKSPRHFILFRDENDVNSNLTSKHSDPAKRGFDFNGQPCDIQNTAGDDNCPYQLTLTFTPVCTGNNCAKNTSSMEINGQIYYKPSAQSLKIPFNSENFKFSFTRPARDGVQVTEPPPPPPEPLVYNQHTVDNCTNYPNLGGTVLTDGANKFCRFNAGGCPSGWAPYKNFTQTSNGTAYYNSYSGTDNGPCDGMSYQQSCTTTHHGWGDVVRESKFCGNTSNINRCGGDRVTAYAIINKIGCF